MLQAAAAVLGGILVLNAAILGALWLHYRRTRRRRSVPPRKAPPASEHTGPS